MPNVHNSVSQAMLLSAGRRQRTRKPSKPQKRQQHSDAREGCPEMGLRRCEDSYSLQHKLQQVQAVGSVAAGSCDAREESRDTAHPGYEESERVLMDSEDRADGIKKETAHEFIVDQWYDLGPSPHKYAYSPASPGPMNTEKVEIKESTPDSCTVNSLQNEPSQISQPKLENRTSNIISSGETDSGKGMRLPDSAQVYPPADREAVPGPTELAQGKEPYQVTDVVGPSDALPIPLLQPFLGCPLPSTGNSFILQPNHFPLSMHATAPYFNVAAASNPPPHDNASNNTSVNPSHSHPYMTSLSTIKPDISYSHVGPEAGVSAFNHCSQHCSDYNRSDQLLSTTPVLPCPISLSSAPPNSVSFHGPAVSGHFFAPRYTRYEAAVECRQFLYPNSFYQSSSFHSSGVLLVPSHPYYVQQMPFVPLIPAVNCNHMHVDVPTCSPNVATETQASICTLQEVGRNLETPTGSSSVPLMTAINPVSTSVSVTETDKSGWKEKQAVDTSATSQYSSRVKVKPKITSSTDFIDPTRIKFGIDDVDTDDDLSKLNDCSDCSDKEWQPNKKDLKTCYTRDSDSGDGWTPKEDRFIESDNSVKKTYSRRRKRSSKELAECNECGKVFKGSYYLRRHQMSHSDVRPFQCATCHKCFKQKAHLIGHQSVHERALKLRVADDKLPSPKSKAFVLGSKCPGRPKKAYTEKDLACKECGKIFKTVYRLKRHELSHTDVRPFSCRICGKGFKQTGHRNEHEANHEKTKKRFLCNMCGVVFRCRSSFNNHMRSHGTEKLRLQQTARSDVDGACSETKHENSEVCPTGYDCPYCTEKFATAQALNSHLETHVEVQQRRHVQPYSCDVCRRAFTYRHNLIKHKLIHKAPDKFAQFYKEKFEAHVASGKPSFKCTKCAKVFMRKETLAKHCKIHSGSKPFKCAICSHEFTQNVHLKVHMRKHTGSRPFQCKECNRSFIDSTALAKHIEYEACNADNCLYHCKLCDKLHYYLGSLKQHIRKKHSANEEDVEKYIIKSERSVRRRSTCEGEKHPCKVCSSSFSEKCNLVRHIRRKHASLVELLQKELQGKHTKDVVHEYNIMDSVTKDVVDEYTVMDSVTKDVVDEYTVRDSVTKARDINTFSQKHLASVAEHPCLLSGIPHSNLTISREANVDRLHVAVSGELQAERDSCGANAKRLDVALSRKLPAEDHSCEANVKRLDVAVSRKLPVEDHSCETNVKRLDVAVSRKQQVGDGSCGVNVETLASETREIPPITTRSTATTMPLNISVGPNVTTEGADHSVNCCCQAAERDEARNLFKRKEGDENTGGFWEGFQSSDFALSEKQLGETYARESFLCKNPCCSDVLDNNYPPSETADVHQGEFVTSASKGSVDDESSPITDIHFLYKIGLVVSSKAKVPGDPVVKQSWDNGDSEWNCKPIIPVCESLTTLGNNSLSSDDSKSHSQLSRTEYQNQTTKRTCGRSRSVGFLDDGYNDRGDELTATDGSCSLGFSHGSTQDSNSSPSSSSCNENMASQEVCGIKHHLTVIETIPNEAEHPPNEAEHPSSEAGHPSSKTGHPPSQLELSPLKGEHNFLQTCNSSAVKYMKCNKTLMEHSAAECHNKNRIDNNNMGISDTSVLQGLETVEFPNLVADRCVYTKSERQAVHPKLKNRTAKRSADNGCTLSTATTKLTSAAQPRMSNELDNEDHQQSLDLKHCAPSAVGVRQLELGTSSVTSALVQCDSDRGNTRRISPDFGLTVRATRLLGPETPNCVCAVTNAEAVISESGQVPSEAFTTQHPPVTLSNRPGQISRSVMKHNVPISRQGEILSKKRKYANTCSLTHNTAKDKIPNSSEYGHLPADDVFTPVAPRVHSRGSSSRSMSSHVTAAESSKNDYEACPTESHLKCLGLLACKDAQEVRNKSTPIEDLYQTYKPWLEELVHRTRPRRSKFGDKWSSAVRSMKVAGSATTDATGQLSHTKCPPSDSIENKIQPKKASVCDSAESPASSVDTQQTIRGELNVLQGKWTCMDKRVKNLQESNTDPKKLQEQSLLTLAESGTKDVGDLLTSRKNPRSISPVAQQLVTTPASLPASATANSHTEAKNSSLEPTVTLSAGGSKSVSRYAGSSSPPSTPDSTVRGKQLFACLVCNKYFTARHQLKRHDMTHTNHRPYTCDKCGRAFRQKVHLSDHIKRHQGQRPFVCAGCGKRFVLKNEMNQHIKNHCRGSLDVFRSVTVVSDKRIFPMAMKDSNQLPGAGEPVTQPNLENKEYMLMLGQCYKAGDVISNGAITLTVIESANIQSQEKRDSSNTMPLLVAPPPTAGSQTTG